MGNKTSKKELTYRELTCVVSAHYQKDIAGIICEYCKIPVGVKKVNKININMNSIDKSSIVYSYNSRINNVLVSDHIYIAYYCHSKNINIMYILDKNTLKLINQFDFVKENDNIRILTTKNKIFIFSTNTNTIKIFDITGNLIKRWNVGTICNMKIHGDFIFIMNDTNSINIYDFDYNHIKRIVVQSNQKFIVDKNNRVCETLSMEDNFANFDLNNKHKIYIGRQATVYNFAVSDNFIYMIDQSNSLYNYDYQELVHVYNFNGDLIYLYYFKKDVGHLVCIVNNNVIVTSTEYKYHLLDLNGDIISERSMPSYSNNQINIADDYLYIYSSYSDTIHLTINQFTY